MVSRLYIIVHPFIHSRRQDVPNVKSAVAILGKTGVRGVLYYYAGRLERVNSYYDELPKEILTAFIVMKTNCQRGFQLLLSMEGMSLDANFGCQKRLGTVSCIHFIYVFVSVTYLLDISA